MSGALHVYDAHGVCVTQHVLLSQVGAGGVKPTEPILQLVERVVGVC